LLTTSRKKRLATASLFCFHFLISQKRASEPVRHNQSRAQERAADDIAQPMHARDQSFDHHESRESKNDRDEATAQSSIFDTVTQLHSGCRHHAQSKHRRRGRIGHLQNAVDQNRTVIDDKHLKKDVCNHHDNVKPAKNQKTAINPKKTSPVDSSGQLITQKKTVPSMKNKGVFCSFINPSEGRRRSALLFLFMKKAFPDCQGMLSLFSCEGGFS